VLCVTPCRHQTTILTVETSAGVEATRGIGGSVLVGPDGALWDVSAWRLVGVVIGTGRLSVGEDDRLRADRLIDSMTVIPGLVALPGYDAMVGNLRTWFGAGIKIVDYRAGRRCRRTRTCCGFRTTSGARSVMRR